MTFEQRLITLVSEYEVLYNPGHPCYLKASNRNAAWDEIAQKLDSGRKKCRNRWKNLRDTYKKLLIKINDAGGVYRFRRRKWQYFSLIAFVNKYEHLAPKEDNTNWPIFEDTCKETLAMAKANLEVSENVVGNATVDTVTTNSNNVDISDTEENSMLNFSNHSNVKSENEQDAILGFSNHTDIKIEHEQQNEQSSMLNFSHHSDLLSQQSSSAADEIEQDKKVVELTHSYAKSIQNESEQRSGIEVYEPFLSKSNSRNYLAMLGAKIDAAGIPSDVQINLEERISELVHDVLTQYGHHDQHVVYAEDIS